MTISTIYPIGFNNCSKQDLCSICLAPLDSVLEGSTGEIVYHRGVEGNNDGIKHPMHFECVKGLFENNIIANCPTCKCRIQWPKDDLLMRITRISTLIVIAGAAHGVFSYLTNRPLIMAIVPSVIASLKWIDLLRTEEKEGVLNRPFDVELKKRIKTSVALIGVPCLASMAASKITESVIPNSFITATFGMIGLIPFVKGLLTTLPR